MSSESPFARFSKIDFCNWVLCLFDFHIRKVPYEKVGRKFLALSLRGSSVNAVALFDGTSRQHDGGLGGGE